MSKPMTKFDMVRDAILKEFGTPGIQRPKLLDVGCRDCVLKKYVGDLVEYEGVDLFQNKEKTVDYVQDFSKGVPLPDGSFDTVVALDLVEHLDDLPAGLEELLRLTRNQLIVLIPNMAHANFRLNFLLSGRLSGKYDLRYGMGVDRHRWVTVIPQIDEFIGDFSQDRQLTHKTERLLDTKKKTWFAKLASTAGMGPSWWAWASVYILKKPALIHV